LGLEEKKRKLQKEKKKEVKRDKKTKERKRNKFEENKGKEIVLENFFFLFLFSVQRSCSALIPC